YSFTAPSPTQIYTLSLHDALPILQVLNGGPGNGETVVGRRAATYLVQQHQRVLRCRVQDGCGFRHLHHEGRAPASKIVARANARSEEHTSELQSRSDLVCRLLLEK